MRKILMTAGAAVALLTVTIITAAAEAATNTLTGQSLFGWLQPYVQEAVSAVILAALGWGSMILRKKFNLDIDESNRKALASFLERQASSLVADGFVKVNGLNFHVNNAAVAAAANTAAMAIPGALNHFGLTAEKVGEMILDKIPSVPAAAAVAAASTPPQTTASAAAADRAQAGSQPSPTQPAASRPAV